MRCIGLQKISGKKGDKKHDYKACPNKPKYLLNQEYVGRRCSSCDVSTQTWKLIPQPWCGSCMLIELTEASETAKAEKMSVGVALRYAESGDIERAIDSLAAVDCLENPDPHIKYMRGKLVAGKVSDAIKLMQKYGGI